MPYSFLVPTAVVRDAGAKGLGVYASAPIPAGTTVAAFGGTVLDRESFAALDEGRRVHSIQVDDDLFMVGPAQPEPADMFNHSCEPNCGLVGNVLLVAMTDVPAGQELCFDYAMCDSDDYDEFVCSCGTPSCRGLVTGADWMRPDLQARYAGWFSSFLARKIREQVEAG